jgi:hypothetical protein
MVSIMTRAQSHKHGYAKAGKRMKSNCFASEPIVIHPSVSHAFRLVARYLPLDHQVVYCYSPEKVRTLFENKLDSFHWLSWDEIEHLCTIHILGVDPCKFLPGGGILRSGGHKAGSADESSLER